MNVNLTTWGLEKGEEYRVHLELLRDTTVDRVIAIDTDLINGFIGEVKSDSGMSGRPSDVNKDFANNLIGIDADRVKSKGARLLPQSLQGGVAMAMAMGRGRHDASREITEPFQSKGGLYNTFQNCATTGMWCGVVWCGGFVEAFQQDKEKKAGTDEIRTREVSHHGLDRA